MKLFGVSESEEHIRYYMNTMNIMIILSIIGGMIYLKSYFKMTTEIITFEHKFIFYLSIGLIIANNPLEFFLDKFYMGYVAWSLMQIFLYIGILIFILSICN